MDLDHVGGTDKIYEMLDGEEGDLGRIQREATGWKGQGTGEGDGGGRRTRFPAVDNEERKPRSMEEMEEEAEKLAVEMEKESLD